MAAAAAEAPVGNHHVLATKKYVLAKVISQITQRRTSPMYQSPAVIEKIDFTAYCTASRADALKLCDRDNRAKCITAEYGLRKSSRDVRVKLLAEKRRRRFSPSFTNLRAEIH